MLSTTHPYSVFTISENAKTLKCTVADAVSAESIGSEFLNDSDVTEVWITCSFSAWVTRLRPGQISSAFYAPIANDRQNAPDEPTGSPEAKVLSHATETDDGVHWAIRRLEEKRQGLIEQLRIEETNLYQSNLADIIARQTHYLTALRWMLTELPDSAIDCGE